MDDDEFYRALDDAGAAKAAYKDWLAGLRLATQGAMPEGIPLLRMWNEEQKRRKALKKIEDAKKRMQERIAKLQAKVEGTVYLAGNPNAGMPDELPEDMEIAMNAQISTELAQQTEDSRLQRLKEEREQRLRLMQAMDNEPIEGEI